MVLFRDFYCLHCVAEKSFIADDAIKSIGGESKGFTWFSVKLCIRSRFERSMSIVWPAPELCRILGCQRFSFVSAARLEEICSQRNLHYKFKVMT